MAIKYSKRAQRVDDHAAPKQDQIIPVLWVVFGTSKVLIWYHIVQSMANLNTSSKGTVAATDALNLRNMLLIFSQNLLVGDTKLHFDGSL